MAIRIIETAQGVNISKVDKYNMTVSPAIVLVKDVPDATKIKVMKWLLYNDEKDGKDPVELLSFLAADGKAYSTSSPTFKDAFSDIVFCMADDSGVSTPFTLVKTSGKSKAGRTYVTCYLDNDTEYGE